MLPETDKSDDAVGSTTGYPPSSSSSSRFRQSPTVQHQQQVRVDQIEEEEEAEYDRRRHHHHHRHDQGHPSTTTRSNTNSVTERTIGLLVSDFFVSEEDEESKQRWEGEEIVNMAPGLPNIKILDSDALSDLLEDNVSPPEITSILYVTAPLTNIPIYQKREREKERSRERERERYS